MPTLFCCILNCESESVNCKKRKIFYRLPQNSDRKQMWLNQIGDRIKYGTVSSNSRICNSHFATGKPNLDSSHIDYVPTIFPWSSKEDKMKSYKSVEEYESKIKKLEQKILAKAFFNASSGSKLCQESSTTKFDLPENDICSKLIIDTTLSNDLNKHNNQKSPIKSSNVSELNKFDQKPIIVPNLSGKHFSTEPVLIPVFQDSLTNAHTNQANNSSSTIQMVPDNTISIKSNFLNYLLSSLAHVNMATSNNNNSDFVNSLSVNVAMPTGPLNLSQSYNKLDDQIVKKEKINVIDINKKDEVKKDLVNQPDSNNEKGSNLPQRKNSLTTSQIPDRTTTPSEETTSRSCTCTKSSCLKLYCECFANGNTCCSGCTCINCRNNDNFKEERTKIVNSYLERDPWVFSSKIENKEVGKKHSKGCNCLKSSCLKNYCECFENKVFCSSLCRCRMCYNNEEHTQHSNREETKIYASSHTSESLSVMSENSPRDTNRKRKQSSTKVSEIYEDVSSNESENEINSKRCQLESRGSIENDKQSNRSINSMEIPPVLPQEDDFTEEELALMLKFREQRSEKPSNVKTECVSPQVKSFQPHQTNDDTASSNTQSEIAGSIINVPSQIDSNLLLTLSKSLAVANLGLNGINIVNTTLQESKKSSGIDFLNLLAAQQLMVSPQPSEAQNLNCIAVPQNCNHVIPINLTQIPTSCITQITSIPSSVVTHSRLITTSSIPVTSSMCQSKPKLSTEDYVRKHIEAAERAVRADYMRKDNSVYKKPITRQKVKIEPFPISSKPPQHLINIKPALNSCSGSNDLTRVTSQIPIICNKPYEENCTINTPQLTNGRTSCSETISTNVSPASSETISPTPYNGYYNCVSISASPHVPSIVQMNCLSKPVFGSEQLTNNPVIDFQSEDKYSIKIKNKTLRNSFQSLRSEIRSLKLHMRADQSKLRRLEKNVHQLRLQIGNIR